MKCSELLAAAETLAFAENGGSELKAAKLQLAMLRTRIAEGNDDRFFAF